MITKWKYVSTAIMFAKERQFPSKQLQTPTKATCRTAYKQYDVLKTLQRSTCKRPNCGCHETALLKMAFLYQDKGNILVKSAGKNATVSDDVNYKTRVSLKDDFSLVITKVTMDDQRIFTCMVVSGDILEFPVQLAIYSKCWTQKPRNSIMLTRK